MVEKIKPYHKKFHPLSDSQNSYQVWRVGLGIENESSSSQAIKMINEIRELDHEFDNGGDRWTFAGEAVDIFMFGISAMTTYGIWMNQHYKIGEQSISTFEDLESLAKVSIPIVDDSKWKEQLKMDLHEGVTQFAFAVVNKDHKKIEASCARLLLYSTRLINFLGFSMSDIFTGKFHRNEDKYKIDPVVRLAQDYAPQAFLALARASWDKNKDPLYLQAEVSGREIIYEPLV